MLRRLFFAVIACALSLLPLSLGCREARTSLPALPGNPAPPFSLTDTAGKTVSLSNFSGKVVVLDFWATWCGPCKEAMADLEILHRKYAGQGVVIVGINVNKESDAAARMQEFAKGRGLTYTLAHDNGSAYKAYGVTRIPATFILDRSHAIRETHPGFRPGLGKEIGLTIEKLLEAPPK